MRTAPIRQIWRDLAAAQLGGLLGGEIKASADTLPKLLHWFKWQSYTTWISGTCLLILIYFSGKGAYHGPHGLQLGFGDAAGLAIAVLAGGWMLYDPPLVGAGALPQGTPSLIWDHWWLLYFVGSAATSLGVGA